MERAFPGGRLYGPYHHGGRSYYQWMARGPFLRDTLVPLLDRHLSPELDAKAHARFQAMKADYARLLAPPKAPSGVEPGPRPPSGADRGPDRSG